MSDIFRKNQAESIDTLKQKIDRQSKIIKELQQENQELKSTLLFPRWMKRIFTVLVLGAIVLAVHLAIQHSQDQDIQEAQNKADVFSQMRDWATEKGLLPAATERYCQFGDDYVDRTTMYSCFFVFEGDETTRMDVECSTTSCYKTAPPIIPGTCFEDM